jgi:hypothetical protein
MIVIMQTLFHKKLYTGTIYICFFCLLIGSCQKNGSYTNEPLKTNQIMKLGVDSTNSSRMFKMPTEAITHKDKIFVVDAGENVVRVYNRGGKFLRDIGSEGSGPGEFNSIDDIYIDKNDRLLVIDSNEGRVSFFSLQGDLVDIQKLPPVSNIEQITELSPNNYVIVGTHDRKLVHVLGNQISTINASLAKIEDILKTQKRLEKIWIQYAPGKILPINQDSLLYSSDIYSGKTLLYSKIQGNWEMTDTFVGLSKHSDNPVTFTQIEQADRTDAPIMYDNTRYAAQFHSKSDGFFRQSKDTLIHFSRQESSDGNKIYLMAEQFNTQGELLNYATIDSMDSYQLEVLDLKNKTIFISDTRKTPHLKSLNFN